MKLENQFLQANGYVGKQWVAKRKGEVVAQCTVFRDKWGMIQSTHFGCLPQQVSECKDKYCH